MKACRYHWNKNWKRAYCVQDEHKNDIKIRITEIAEMYAGHFMFMSDEYYEKALGKNMKKMLR